MQKNDCIRRKTTICNLYYRKLSSSRAKPYLTATDGHTYYVMSAKSTQIRKNLINFYANKILTSHSLYYRKPNLLARVRLMVIHTM